MQQRQLRLGDILDDYCPRERRVTNHAVVAMIGADVKQTRCTTCDAEHEYKHAKVPRQRRKPEAPAALAQSAGGPKVVPHEPEMVADATESADIPAVTDHSVEEPAPAAETELAAQDESLLEPDEAVEADAETPGGEPDTQEEGPVHRPLIRATLPRVGGQQPPPRPAPEFTIRQPGGRQNRFRPRQHGGGGQQFFGNRSNGNQGGGHRQGGWNSRSQDGGGGQRRRGQGHKRSK